MRPPRFWSRSPDNPSWQARSLAPLSALYAAVTSARVARDGASVGVPVICIGNINAGGTGKTPTAMAVLQMLQAMGREPHVISRGYGGRTSETLRVDERVHSADLVGDEPLLLAAFAPTWVGRNRASSARAAVAAGAGAIVMDDGFQNPDLAKDMTVVVADAQTGFGNGRVIPAGPLREPVAAGLARADLLLCIGDDCSQRLFDKMWGATVTCPRLRGTLVPLPTGMPWAGLRAFAFAGIGRPQKFFDTLGGLGVELVETRALDDHQALGAALLARLERDAQSLGAQLVTTEKDAVRLPVGFRQKVLTLPVRLQIEDDAPLRTTIEGLFYSVSRKT